MTDRGEKPATARPRLMSRTRVYVPSTWAGLRDLVVSNGSGPPPMWEYVALRAVARSCCRRS